MSRMLIEFSDLSSLHDKIKRLPNIAERAINEVLHTQGIEIVTHEMTNLLPDNRRNKSRNKLNKKHSKTSKWSTFEQHNLGFVVKTKGGAASKKGSFGYLVFPDEGRGPHNPHRKNYSGRAAQAATPKILEKLHGSLDNLLDN